MRPAWRLGVAILILAVVVLLVVLFPWIMGRLPEQTAEIQAQARQLGALVKERLKASSKAVAVEHAQELGQLVERLIAANLKAPMPQERLQRVQEQLGKHVRAWIIIGDDPDSVEHARLMLERCLVPLATRRPPSKEDREQILAQARELAEALVQITGEVLGKDALEGFSMEKTRPELEEKILAVVDYELDPALKRPLTDEEMEGARARMRELVLATQGPQTPEDWFPVHRTGLGRLLPPTVEGMMRIETTVPFARAAELEAVSRRLIQKVKRRD